MIYGRTPWSCIRMTLCAVPGSRPRVRAGITIFSTCHATLFLAPHSHTRSHRHSCTYKHTPAPRLRCSSSAPEPLHTPRPRPRTSPHPAAVVVVLRLRRPSSLSSMLPFKQRKIRRTNDERRPTKCSVKVPKSKYLQYKRQYLQYY